MKNINRDYIVDVNVKNSTVSIGNNMKFYITDINTSNIYFKLDINASSNRYIGLYGQKENSDDYSLTLRIINPNNKPFEIIADRMDKPDNFFVVDLAEDQKDQIGTYRCELFIDTDINGRAERSTTNSFTYEVVKSIMNDLDEVIEDAPDFPLVDTFATKEYVDNAVANGTGGSVDLGAYPTTEQMNAALATKADSEHTHPDTIVNNYSSSNNTFNLTTDKYQKAINLSSNMSIALPEVDRFTEIHLFLTPDREMTITLPSAKYQNTPTIELGKTYEFIFTYIGDTWLAGVIVYG